MPRSFSLRTFGLVLAAVAVAAFALGRLGGGSGGDAAPPPAATAADAAPTMWTCSMHPQIILPSNDQKCPICFMDLIPLSADQGEGLEPGDLRLSPAGAALAEVRTAKAARRPVSRPVRLVGRITEDETLVRSITARFPGRLEHLHVDATGVEVKAGEPLVDVYSPQLYAAQTELRSAARAAAADPAAVPTLRAAEARLRLLGLAQSQVEAILAGDEVRETLTVTAPLGGIVTHRAATRGDYVKTGQELYAIADLSRVWLRLDAFESDVPWLREGQDVTFTTRAWPGRSFAGTIAFIDPVLDARSRSVEVRVAVANADRALKPGMLAAAVAEVALAADGTAAAAGAGVAPPLVIPATAPLLTGSRAVVYVKRPGEGDPVFRGREVVLGPRAGDWYVVSSGVDEGEEVVVHGAFKIDSALQIRAQPSMMDPAGVGGGAPHDHGGHGAAPAAGGAAGAGGDALPPSPCLRDALAGVLAAYLPLQVALAGDDDAAAAAAAREVAARLHAVDCADGPLPAATAEAWRALGPQLAEVADAVAAAGGIAARRLAFEPLSDGLWTVLGRFGVDEVAAVRRFHCPMALDGAGAYWLQDGPVTANPYYGAAMLRCGSQAAVLGDVGGGEGRDHE